MIYRKELAHVIMKAEKSQELQGEMASWRPRRANGIRSSQCLKASEPGVNSVVQGQKPAKRHRKR